ncbi:hypothetical protein ScPMuIL_000260 [Solemya velum]
MSAEPFSEGSVPRQRRSQTMLQKSGGRVNPPTDDATFYVSDDYYGFLETGRDFEPIYVSHKYTEEEKETLSSFESLDYLPSHSDVYRKWIKRQKPTGQTFDAWLVMGFIGFVVGLIGFVMHQLIEEVATWKWRYAQKYLEEERMAVACVFTVGYNVVFILFSVCSVVFLRPSAGGSGIPEVTGFLNGTLMRHIFNVRTMVVKFLSCVAAVGSGFPVGPEGPMIHLGALVGAGLSQFRSESLRINLPMFERFRNPMDRRNFISAGAAAGVASAFGSPVGGLLFSMEEVSSYWTTTLSWQIFFCCMLATFTTDLFNSAFHGFEFLGSFGQFKTERYILFNIDKGIDVNIVMFIPTVVIGVIGGFLGAAFTILNLKIARARKRILAGISRLWVKNSIRVLEPVIIMVSLGIFSIFIPMAFSCTEFTCMDGTSDTVRHGCWNDTRNPVHVESVVARYTCPLGARWRVNNDTWMTNGTYNEVATLLFGTFETAVKHLFSRDTHLQFGYLSLFTVLCFYFVMICWASGTSVSCGTLVPMLLVGGLYGRMIGLVLTSMFGIFTDVNSYWRWMDPGAFALIGAASFFGGVTRLALAVTVIMMELTNDVQVLLPVMVSVMVAKWVGDFFTHPIYHALLELKCIPFLEPEPRVAVEKKPVNLELFSARDVMSSPVITIHTRELVPVLANLLLNTKHGGFPVIKRGDQGAPFFYGIITRLELSMLLMFEGCFEEEGLEIEEEKEIEATWIEYEQFYVEKLANPIEVSETLNRYMDEPKYKDLYINLTPYINQSAFSVPEKFSLQRTYVLFRTLGIRHLTVVDNMNRVKGIISRKDLMGHNIEEKLTKVWQQTLEGVERLELRDIAGSSPVDMSV